MSKEHEKRWRAAFRDNVLTRDGYKCVVCGEPGTNETLDPHHITDRHDIPNGGYVVENGITLCNKPGGCHEKAEAALKDSGGLKFGRVDFLVANSLHPGSLYTKIGSSYERAIEASKRLGDAH
jgi:hypothetical protein